MSKPILVGYDPRSGDRSPIDFGIAAARLTGAPVVVAVVQADGSVLSAGRAPAHVDDELLEDVSDDVEALRGELAPLDIAVDCDVLHGTSAARALHEAAEEREAGLLVTGSTQRGVVGRVLPGSTAARLLHGAPCPVAIVPRGWQTGGGLNTVGVASVDSDEAREALRGAHALARRGGARLRVITIVSARAARFSGTEAYHVSAPAEPAKDVADAEGERRLEAERNLRQFAAGLDGDVPVEVEAFVGDPADVLIGVSENLDLLVCGSRGYGPLRAVLLGGVTWRVAAEAHCPVVVLPRGVKAPLEALAGDAPGAGAAAPA